MAESEAASPPPPPRTMFSAVASSAQAAVRKGRAALTSLSEQVAADEHSRTFSALQSQRFSILDAYSAGAGGGVEAEVRRSEQREAELRLWRESSSSLSCWQRCRVNTWQYFRACTNAPSSWIYLILLGILGAIIAFLVEMPVGSLLAFRSQAVAEQPSAGFIIWVLWALAGGLVSAAITHALPLVEGSGIPQVKSILSGSSLSHYLSFRVGAAKLVGLVAAQGGGLSTGREGPFVHIACCVGAKLWQVPYFRTIASSDQLRRQMLAAAVAAGVTGVFGAPISGVLFGMEARGRAGLDGGWGAGDSLE